jgi:hypothetical protein
MTNVEERDGIALAAETIGSGDTFSQVLESRDAKTISGIVDRSASYDIDLVWLTNEGSDIVTESIASGASGQTEFSEEWHSPKQCRIEVTDTSSSSADAGITVLVT